MWKFLAVLAALGGYAALMGYGPNLGLPDGIGLVALMLALPLSGVVFMFVMFHRWHRAFHRRMVTDGIRWRREISQ